MIKILGFNGSVMETSMENRKHFKWIWVDIFNARKEEMKAVSDEFSISLEELGDIMTLEDIPRVEKEDNRLLIFFRTPFSTDVVSTIAIVIGKNYVLSFHEEKSVVAKLVYSSCMSRPPKNPRELVARIISTAVNEFSKLDDLIDRKLDRMEERIIAGEESNISELYEWREMIGELYRALQLDKSALSELMKLEQFNKHEKIEDSYYDVLQLIDFFSSYKEAVVNLIELHMNMQNIRLQEVMKFLAVITFLAAIPTVISGIYGMNFRHLPMAYHPLGFWVSLSLIIISMALALVYFKKKKWI